VLILPVEEARAGMTLAAPVQSAEDPEIELLKAGYVLEDTVLERMREIGIRNIFVAYPPLHDLDRHLDPLLSEPRRQMYAQIKHAFAAAQGYLQPVDVAFTDYYMSVRELVLTLLAQGRHPIYLDQLSRLGRDVVGHAASVAHLALLLGIKLERYLIDQRKRLPPLHAREVINLGVAGMLHDVGKLRLAPHLRDCNCLDTIESDSDRLEYELHPRMGYESIHDGVEPSAAAAVLNHHQHYDGSGFPMTFDKSGEPRMMRRGTIHVFARILFVADLYDRLATVSGRNERRSNLEVLWLMRTQHASHCDPVVLQTLHAIAPPFPPGSRLGLSDGTIAVVTAVDPSDPFHPTVKRLGRDFWTLEDEAMDLSLPGMPGVTKIGTVDVDPYMPPRDTLAFMRA
jgi:HD-GYP domain-containing protein (c-di-GMP phosphodiesterase class II)